MNFGHPRLLWIGLALLPLLGLFLWVTWRKRQSLVRQFVQHKSLALATLGVSIPRQKLKRVLLFLAVGFLLFTIARPQWGFTWEEASQRGRDIIVAIDTSRSMLAEDIQPNRLARAKLAALDLLKLGKFDRFGLVAFSGSAFLQCPLTYDDEAFRQSVQILQTGIIPQGGTALGQAIQAARDAFGQDADENHRILVLFTDGEDHEQGDSELVTDAVDAGMKIFTIGVGTPAGELLRTRDERGNLVYVKDDAGNVVKSRLNEKLLQEIATKGRGFYLQLAGGNTMEVLYEKGLAPLPTSERTSKLMKRFKEQFYWPLAAAILLLIIEVFLPDQKRPARTVPANTPSSPLAATVPLLFLLLMTPGVLASPASAQREYKAGNFNGALSEYQELLGKSPNDPRLHYNAAAAAYQAGKFDLALKEFQAAAASPDLDLQQQSYYNLGNSEYRLGESAPTPQEKIAIWEQAVQHFDAALKLNSADKDAEFNRDFVKKKLEELKQQQQKEQDKNQNKDNQEKNQQDKDDPSKDQQQQKNNEDQQQKEDQSKQDEKSQEQKQDNPSQDEQKKSEEEKQRQQQEQQQKQQDQQKQDQANKSDQPPSKEGENKESEDKEPQADSQGQYAQLGKMTPAQAKQLLDAQKGEEKALIFVPPDRKSDRQPRSFKDW